jgi:esterase/lipase superfamily enzyme
MHRSYHQWKSPVLDRKMELLVFGYAGARVLAFPTSMGRFYDWEDRGLVGTLGELIRQGWLQLFCVDSIDAESWYDRNISSAQRVARHAQYDQYLLDEVLPFTLQANTNPFLIATGASFGAYHAVNFALRHPDKVGRVLGMSGIYDIKQFVDGYSNDQVYYNNPCEYVWNEHDPARVEGLKRMDIILAVGRDDPLCASNRRLSEALWSRGIWHALRIWDGFAHDWPYWARMLHLYLGGHD